MKGFIAVLVILGSIGVAFYFSNTQKKMQGTLKQQCTRLSSIQIESKLQICAICINMTQLQQKLAYKIGWLQFLQSQSLNPLSSKQSFQIVKVKQNKIKENQYDFKCEEYLQLINFNEIGSQQTSIQGKKRNLFQFQNISSVLKIVKNLDLNITIPEPIVKVQKQFAIIYKYKTNSSTTSIQKLKFEYFNKNIEQVFERLSYLIYIFLFYTLLKCFVQILKRKRQRQLIELFGISVIYYGILIWKSWSFALSNSIIFVAILLTLSYIKLQASKSMIFITLIAFVGSQFLPNELNLISWCIFPLQIIYRFKSAPQRQSLYYVASNFICLALIKIVLQFWSFNFLILAEMSQFLILILSPILISLIKEKQIQQFKQFQQNKGISLKGYQNEMQEMYED